MTAWNSLFGQVSNSLKPGSTILAEGTGSVSIVAAQIAIYSGSRCILTSSSDEKLQIIRDSFPSHLQHLLVGVNYKKTPDWDEEVKKITNGNGVDQVIEVGGSSTAAKALACVKRGGLLSAVGFLAQGEKNPDLAVLILKSGANFVSREPNVRT